MRIPRWTAWLVVFLSMAGIFYGLAAYTFAGWPWGSHGPEIAKAEFQAALTAGVSMVFLAIGICLLVVGRRRNARRNHCQAQP
jgi:hypothetical protein